MAQDAFPELWAGFRWLFLGVFRVIFLLVFGIYFHFSLFHASSSSPTPPVAVAGGMAMAFVDDCFLPLKARSSFHFLFFCFTYFAGFVALPFRGAWVGLENPHLRLMF